MRSKFRNAVVMLAGAALGALAVEGLHAQGTKLKAYVVSENEILDASAQTARKLIQEAHGHALRMAAGRVVQIEGGAPPKSAAPTSYADVEYRDITSEGLLRASSFKAYRKEQGGRDDVCPSCMRRWQN
jgi:hypothetical protein